MREKRYSKDMKGTQEEERKLGGAIKDYVRLTENGKYEENVNMYLAKDEENKEEAEKVLKEVFAGKGLKLEQVCANNYKTTFFIKGKLII